MSDSRKFQFRGFVSILLSLSFVVVVTTGLVLWLAHSPQTFGIGKGVWKHTHIFTSLLMLVAGLIHLWLNWSILWSYLWEKASRRLSKPRELALAIAIMALVTVPGFLGGGGEMPPFARMSVTEIATKAGQTTEGFVASLQKQGIAVHNPADPLTEVAKYNEVPVERLFGVIEQQTPGALRFPSH
jgi:hypothetical protein